VIHPTSLTHLTHNPVTGSGSDKVKLGSSALRENYQPVGKYTRD